MNSTAIISIVFALLLLVALIVVVVIWRNGNEQNRELVAERDRQIAEGTKKLSATERELSEERIAHARTESERDAL